MLQLVIHFADFYSYVFILLGLLFMTIWLSFAGDIFFRFFLRETDARRGLQNPIINPMHAASK
jgi:hypothetical protein